MLNANSPNRKFAFYLIDNPELYRNKSNYYRTYQQRRKLYD